MATKKELGLLPLIAAAMQNASAPYALYNVKDVAGLVKDGLVEQNSDIANGDTVATRLTQKGLEAVNIPDTNIPDNSGDNSGAAGSEGAANVTTGTENTGTENTGTEAGAGDGTIATGSMVSQIEAGGFTYDMGVDLGAGRGRANQNSGVTAKVDAMPVGASFFVPKTAESEHPSKSLSSTVSTVKKKYASPVLDEAGKPVQETYVIKGVSKTRDKVTYSRDYIVKTVKENGVEGARIKRTL